jgi:hypothetical protein
MAAANKPIPMTLRRFPEEAVVEIELHITREFKARLWIGKRLIVLACRIMGCGVKFEGDDYGV